MVVILLVCYFHRSPSAAAFLVKNGMHQRLASPYTYRTNSQRQSTLNDKEDNILLLPLLEAGLITVSSEADNDDLEDVLRIQELKDFIDNHRTLAEFGVRKVQAEFYDAFSTADPEKMSNVWSRSDDVLCTHPGMHSVHGFSDVLGSWEQMFAAYAQSDDNSFKISPSRVKVDICGKTAIVSCVEQTNAGMLEALNIYRREGGSWKMVNHIASPIFS